MTEPYVRQLRTGKVKTLGEEHAADPMDRKWETGMFKDARQGNVFLSETGLTNDEVADTRVHGGPEKALFAYPVKHYTYWRERYGLDAFKAGGFGENLVIENTDEKSTCIGDIYRYGEAIIQVSQPRQPCWKPARRFRILDLSLQIQQTGLTGWYYRVLTEGEISAEARLTLLERPHPTWTIAKCNEVMHQRKEDIKLAKALADLPALAPNWKRTLNKRIQGKESSIHNRVYGKNIDD